MYGTEILRSHMFKHKVLGSIRILIHLTLAGKQLLYRRREIPELSRRSQLIQVTSVRYDRGDPYILQYLPIRFPKFSESHCMAVRDHVYALLPMMSTKMTTTKEADKSSNRTSL